MVAAVRVFYAWLARKHIVREDIGAALTYPDAGVKYPGVLSVSNAERLMMAPDVNTFLGLRDAAIIAVVLGCGLRASEVVGMNQGDLQFCGHDGREVLDIIVRGKRNRERIVPTPPEVWALVRAYLGHDALDKIDRSLKNGDAVLFISTRNGRVSLANYFGERRRLNRRAVFQIFDRYARRLGIPKGERHPHAARHRFATELAEGGADPLLVVDDEDAEVRVGHGANVAHAKKGCNAKEAPRPAVQDGGGGPVTGRGGLC